MAENLHLAVSRWIARVCHDVNRAFLAATGKPQEAWLAASEEIKQVMIERVRTRLRNEPDPAPYETPEQEAVFEAVVEALRGGRSQD